MLAAPKNEAAVSVDASDGSEVAPDCEALAEGERDDDAAADGAAPVLKGTLTWR